MPGFSGLPLRERKKREMRQHISDTATALFHERGFDGVTVNEIAKAADVSAMTVFNHFPRKEDLFLDRIPEALDLVVGAVREREPGEEPLGALRRTLLLLADTAHPLSALGDRSPPFWRIVLGSPSLRARAREALAEVEDALAGALADAGAADARLTAALAVAACRTVFVGTAERLLAGDSRASGRRTSPRTTAHGWRPPSAESSTPSAHSLPLRTVAPVRRVRPARGRIDPGELRIGSGHCPQLQAD